MTSFGERGTGGALDHLPARVEGPKGKIKAGTAKVSEPNGERKPARRWDDELKVFVRL
jgi:hypothetical protein